MQEIAPHKMQFVFFPRKAHWMFLNELCKTSASWDMGGRCIEQGGVVRQNECASCS